MSISGVGSPVHRGHGVPESDARFSDLFRSRMRLDIQDCAGSATVSLGLLSVECRPMRGLRTLVQIFGNSLAPTRCAILAAATMRRTVIGRTAVRAHVWGTSTTARRLRFLIERSMRLRLPCSVSN